MARCNGWMLWSTGVNSAKSDIGEVKLYSFDKLIFKCHITEWVGIGLFGVSLLGAILLPTIVTVLEECIYKDYTECYEANDCSETDVCICHYTVEVPRNLTGNVTMYYELMLYDQTEETYAKSRDDKQLSGQLSLTPSNSCGNYTYDGKTPIAPCGAVADSMFTDTISLALENLYLPTIKTGMIKESIKAAYRNPKGDLKKALENFTKPIHWTKNVWELDMTNIDNNGFQNEAFIAWMETDMKRKPLWRLAKEGRYEDGLPSGNYSLRIRYDYLPSWYSGCRLMVLCGDPHEVVKDFTPLILWICLAIVGILIAVITRPIIYVIRHKNTYTATPVEAPM